MRFLKWRSITGRKFRRRKNRFGSNNELHFRQAMFGNPWDIKVETSNRHVDIQI